MNLLKKDDSRNKYQKQKTKQLSPLNLKPAHL